MLDLALVENLDANEYQNPETRNPRPLDHRDGLTPSDEGTGILRFALE